MRGKHTRKRLSKALLAISIALAASLVPIAAAGMGIGSTPNSMPPAAAANGGSPSPGVQSAPSTQLLDTPHREKRITDASGQVTIQVTTGEQTTTRQGHFWLKRPGKMRFDVHSPEAAAGDVIVANHVQRLGIYYDESANTVHRVEFTPRARSGSGPGLGMAAGLATPRELLRSSNMTVTYERMATVDGNRTVVMTITPPPKHQERGVSTVWLDPETSFPVKTKTVLPAPRGPQTTTITTRFTDVRTNTGIADEKFAFEPPADTSVKNHQLTREQIETLLNA